MLFTFILGIIIALLASAGTAMILRKRQIEDGDIQNFEHQSDTDERG